METLNTPPQETPCCSMLNCCFDKKKCLLCGIVAVLVLTVIASLAFFFGQQLGLKQVPLCSPCPACEQATAQPSQTTLPTEASAKAGDPTAWWKTYTHIKYGYSFKYPSEMVIRPFDSSESIENSTIIYVNTPDIVGRGIITINSRPYQKKTSFTDAIYDVFISKQNKQGPNTLVDGRPAFFTSSEDEIDTKEKYKTYYVLIQQDDYNYKILTSNYIFPNKNEQDKKIFDQILSTFKFLD